MFERLKKLYREGRIDEKGLQNAVSKGLITAEQMKEIMAADKA